jgi:GT2 family glycosyltransferase
MSAMRERPAGSVGSTRRLLSDPSPRAHLRRLLRAAVQQKSISVVIACHNEERYLQRTVDSLLASLPHRAEIIVVDDQSTDGCCSFLSESGSRYGGVHLARSTARLGVSAARNFGARHARGEILVFCDAHVELPPGWSEPLLRALTDPTAGAVMPAIGILDSQDDARGYGMKFSNSSLDVDWLHLTGNGPYPVPLLCGCFLAMRRDVYQDLKGFDPGMRVYGHEDIELSLHLWLRGYECRVVPEVAVAHRFSSEFRYPVLWEPLYNLLRMGVVHLGQERFFRLIAALAQEPQLGLAWEQLASSDIWARREEIRLARRYDDDWYFKKFAI